MEYSANLIQVHCGGVVMALHAYVGVVSIGVDVVSTDFRRFKIYPGVEITEFTDCVPHVIRRTLPVRHGLWLFRRRASPMMEPVCDSAIGASRKRALG